MPDDVLFVDDIPLGATGKIDKKVLRAKYGSHVLPSIDPAPGGAPADSSLAASTSKPKGLWPFGKK